LRLGDSQATILRQTPNSVDLHIFWYEAARFT
jgi:hypothetical protein